MKFLTRLCSFFSVLCLGSASVVETDLHLVSIPGKSPRTMICFHGYGANYQIAEHLKQLGLIEATLVGFNFPDHDILGKEINPHQLTFGTIQELLPALTVLKKYVIDEGLEVIDLYGFSAGGGALINVLAVLNTRTYDVELQTVGIAFQEKQRLLEAIQKGLIILDTPLKSVEEIIDLRGSSPELEILAKNYRDNHLRPIDSLKALEGLTLDLILHFQERDEILFNRDDALYIERLKTANDTGTTTVVIGNDGGHLAPHFSLWECYAKKCRGLLNNRPFMRIVDSILADKI